MKTIEELEQEIIDLNKEIGYNKRQMDEQLMLIQRQEMRVTKLKEQLIEAIHVKP